MVAESSAMFDLWAESATFYASVERRETQKNNEMGKGNPVDTNEEKNLFLCDARS